MVVYLISFACSNKADFSWMKVLGCWDVLRATSAMIAFLVSKFYSMLLHLLLPSSLIGSSHFIMYTEYKKSMEIIVQNDVCGNVYCKEQL